LRSARTGDKTIAAISLMRDMYADRRREVPGEAPMPFKKEWRDLVTDAEGRVDRKMYETAVLAHLRNKLRSGDVWVERSSGYRRFDSYMVSPKEAEPIVRGLNLPVTADAWLDVRERELDWRLRRFSNRLQRGRLDGVELRDGRLHISPIRTATPPEADALADRLAALMPRIRVTELLHEVARGTGFLSAFTNFRTGETCPNENALLAAMPPTWAWPAWPRPVRASPATSWCGRPTPTFATTPTRPPSLGSSTHTMHCRSPPCGATAPRPAPTDNSSALASEVTWPAR